MATTTDAVVETITLSGLPPVSLVALQLLWDLEARGCSLLILDDGRLRVSPRSSITAADDAAIRQHRDDLIALVRYCEVIQ